MMRPMSEPKTQPAPAHVVMILWGAMLASHLMLVGVALFVRQTSPPAPAGDLQVFSLVLTGCGIATALASSLGIGLIARGQPYFTTMVLRFALAEATTVFGMVLAFLGADLLWFYLLAGLGVVAHLTAFPSPRDAEAHARRT